MAPTRIVFENIHETTEVSPASIIPVILSQHAEDAAVLHSSRTSLTRAPHVRLRHIWRFDDRLAAHLDGLLVGGEQAWPFVDVELVRPTAGAMFVATIVAVQSRSVKRLQHLYALAEAVSESHAGLISAFGWVEQDQLRGIVAGLLGAPNPFLRTLGIGACAMHRIDPGQVRDVALEAPSSALRARALRACGELGRRELLPSCLGMLNAEDPESRFWSAWSAVLLGNRGPALDVLREIGSVPGPRRSRAMRLALQALDQDQAQSWLRKLVQDPEDLRLSIQGAGIAGEPKYVPWLIQHMADKKTARVAGEAFSLITGLDLAYLDLEIKPPEEGSGAGPNDDPADPNVEMDADDGLPWPDPERISRWWDANGGRFDAGERYFMGGTLTREQALRTLKEGFQRQRILAAHYLCLLEPGTPLFEWRAPAFRQQRLLAAMV
jgi:uncharacterized protein (TIGR02270 family)